MPRRNMNSCKRQAHQEPGLNNVEEADRRRNRLPHAIRLHEERESRTRSPATDRNREPKEEREGRKEVDVKKPVTPQQYRAPPMMYHVSARCPYSSTYFGALDHGHLASILAWPPGLQGLLSSVPLEFKRSVIRCAAGFTL